jgi:hypothetical protein
LQQHRSSGNKINRHRPALKQQNYRPEKEHQRPATTKNSTGLHENNRSPVNHLIGDTVLQHHPAK